MFGTFIRMSEVGRLAPIEVVMLPEALAFGRGRSI